MEYRMDFNNILLTFQQLSGCPADRINGELPLVQSSVFQVEAILDYGKVKAIDIPRCEYAAACCAVYDFVCREACKEKIITTPDGFASSNQDFTGRIPAAQKLKNSALAQIGSIVKDNGFLFRTMGGETE
ncbi:MAG: hypothetical protein IJ737_07930 [Ruminococcus sp.]|nr:hypothetical protein [Ruminococcus sp.]